MKKKVMILTLIVTLSIASLMGCGSKEEASVPVEKVTTEESIVEETVEEKTVEDVGYVVKSEENEKQEVEEEEAFVFSVENLDKEFKEVFMLYQKHFID